MTTAFSPAAIFFDFDGVLAATLSIKSQAIMELFAPYGRPEAARILEYHQHHAGISRVEKIAYAHHQILKTPEPETAIKRDIQRFSAFVFERVVAAPWVAGARAFLERNYREKLIFIVSGTPQDELREIIRQRGMTPYFREVLGSPTRKPAHIRDLMDRHRLEPACCVFIGDALTDYCAARETAVPFIGIQGEKMLPDDAPVLPDCTGLDKAIAALGGDDVHGPSTPL